MLPAVDVAETKNEVVVNVEIPACSKEFDISLNRGTLTIKAREKTRKSRGERKIIISSSEGTGFYPIDFTPPESPGRQTQCPLYKDGILRVMLPKI